MIRVTGSGDLFINTFGALEKIELQPNEELVVDNFPPSSVLRVMPLRSKEIRWFKVYNPRWGRVGRQR
jgi:hypothetical protein